MLYQWWSQGGLILQVLLGLNILGWTLMLFKLFQLLAHFKKIEDLSSELSLKYKSMIKSTMDWQHQDLIKFLIESKSEPLLQSLVWVRIIAHTAPLIGLLGTVYGILISFDEISKSGLDDPSLFAAGISLALVTTVGGLGVALPHLVGFNLIQSAIHKSENQLEKKMIASLQKDEVH